MSQTEMDVKALDAVRLIMKLHEAIREIPVGQMRGLWACRVDLTFKFWVNGQRKSLKTSTGAWVRPGDCHIEENGLPLGILSMISGEGVIACGDHLDRFCEALRKGINEPWRLR
jgi:hypothetical protein